jgi:hypothetical protein
MTFTLKPWQKNAAIIAAAVTVVAGVVAGRERTSLEIIQERTKTVADDGINLDKLRRSESSLPQTDPFASKLIEARSAPGGAADKPSAPPLPFRFFGRLTEKGQTDVFVMQGDELIAIKPGQKIGDYRVDQIAEASISFTYLPMKMKQTLDIQ